MESLSATLTEEPPMLSELLGEIPPEAEQVLRKAMEKEPEPILD